MKQLREERHVRLFGTDVPLDRVPEALELVGSSAGQVDEGPEPWAISLALGIILMAVAMGILAAGLIR